MTAPKDVEEDVEEDAFRRPVLLGSEYEREQGGA
jgi:hypothetical protein